MGEKMCIKISLYAYAVHTSLSCLTFTKKMALDLGLKGE